MSFITEGELELLNRRRRAVGKSPLTREQVSRASAESGVHTSDTSFDWFNFWVGYETGIPFSSEGALGAMLHPHHQESSPSYTPDSTPAPSYTPPDPPSAPDPAPSYDSGSSSSSSDSSSSYDSGSTSSSGGGD